MLIEFLTEKREYFEDLKFQPLTIRRNAYEKAFIELSLDSVRISIQFSQMDEMERVLLKQILQFIHNRAEQFQVLRRKPIEV